jgi:hypothetical protein
MTSRAEDALDIVYLAAPLGPRPDEVVSRCMCGWMSADLVTVALECPVCKTGDAMSYSYDKNFIIQYNLRNARTWVRWMIHSRPNKVIVAPWILYCEILDDLDPVQRARGQRDMDALIVYGSVSEVCCVGGRMSSGMKRDAHKGWSAGAHVRDLTKLGAQAPMLPAPQLFDEEHGALIVCPDGDCFEHWEKTGAIRSGCVCDVCDGAGEVPA